ncbi:MAG: hypothetical protein U5L11_10435 [Arhodomonas sp.]|nr:hypothetical protein [Arhodomonas sp.]
MTDKQDETRTSGKEEGNATEESRQSGGAPGRKGRAKPQARRRLEPRGWPSPRWCSPSSPWWACWWAGWWGWQRYQAFAEGQGDLVDASELAACRQ